MVREFSEDAPGWIYDHTAYPVKVTVTKADGQLHAVTDVVPTITNTFETTMLSVEVKVKWVDNNKKKHPVPDSIQVYLAADGRGVGQARLAKKDNWSASFEGMPEYRRSNQARAIQMVPVNYTLAADAVNGFTVSVTGNAKDGYTVTYTATCDLPVTGDSMNLPLLASMMMLSFGRLIGLLRKGKRQ